MNRPDEKPNIRISVRNFVEFLLRSGDIDNRRGNLGQTDAMLQGSRIHRKIQQSMGEQYRAEVTLKLFREEEQYTFTLEGRADGILQDEQWIIIDEIKGVYRDLSEMVSAQEVHLGQAKCYAYIYAMQQELKQIRVQVTYCQMDTEEIVRFMHSYSIEELKDWFENLYDQYRKWIEFKIQARSIRQQSIAGLNFPYSYRDGQDQLIKDVYRSILRKKTLFIQAPTGTGKTIATVFPAVKAVGENLAEQIFYLTAKTITKTAAISAFQLLIKEGYRGRVISITAKDKVCPLEERSCNPVDCQYAKGYYDRVNDAVYELIMQEGIYDMEKLCSYAQEHILCPFELSLDVSLWCDAIICDYNYVFDPNVYLKRFFAEGLKGDYIFLVDESHNLVERARNMYSAVLYKEDFLEMKRFMSQYSNRVSKALESCNKIMLEYKRQCDTYQVLETFSPFHFALLRLSGELERFFKEHPGFDGGEAFGEFYLNLRHFLNMCDIMDESYCVYTQHDEDGRFMIKLYCIDTANVLENRIQLARSTIYFSATLLPIRYYREMLTSQKDPYAVYAKTSFAKEQSIILLANDVSSKYSRRGYKEYRRIADYIRKTVAVKKGNYMVFFPSYRFMQEVGDILASEISEDTYRLVVQSNHMSEQMREEFLEEFQEHTEVSVIGLCVMGGIFSEGIDLTKNRLIGAIIVGTGIPQISNEREILKNYYIKDGKDGFNYAFRYPGMNKVLQAAGRVIRTAQDKGVILLLDERFVNWEYQELFPREWEGYETCNIENVTEKLTRFWETYYNMS